MGRANRSCRNITNKHKTAKIKKTTNKPKTTASPQKHNKFPSKSSSTRNWEAEVRTSAQAPLSITTCVSEDVPGLGRVTGGLQRCHAGSLGMQVRGDTRVQKGGCSGPLRPGVRCSATLARQLRYPRRCCLVCTKHPAAFLCPHNPHGRPGA